MVSTTERVTGTLDLAAEVRAQDVVRHATQIIATAMRLGGGAQEWVHLHTLRPALTGLTRDEQDAALTWLSRANEVEVGGDVLTLALAPEASVMRGCPRYTEAAYRLGMAQRADMVYVEPATW
jgi:hypothetical protein